jgi:hypothetical protein
MWGKFREHSRRTSQETAIFTSVSEGRPAPVTIATTSTEVATTSKRRKTTAKVETDVPTTTATRIASYRYQQLRTDRGSDYNTGAVCHG